jgi:dCMP deaminase
MRMIEESVGGSELREAGCNLQAKLPHPPPFCSMSRESTSPSLSAEGAKQLRYDRAYMRMAQVWGGLSHCQRKQVGALIVKDRMIIADGFNGAPSGFPNPCEDDGGDTHWYVLHAEANAITKLARSNNSSAGATLYITLSPCRECAKLIHQVGIQRVVYAQSYKDISGLSFLASAGVEVVHLPEAGGEASLDPHQTPA